MHTTRNENPLRYLFAKTWQYSAGNRKNIVWFWIMFVIAETVSLSLSPLVIAHIIDTIQRQGITLTNLKRLIGLLGFTVVVRIFFWSLHGPGRLLERANAFKARANYRKYLLRGMMTLPMEWHVEHHSGDSIDKVEKGTTALFQFSEDSFEVIYAVVQLVVSYGMLAYFSHPAAAIVLAMILVTVWITMQFDRILVGQYHELNHCENRVSEGVIDAITNIATVIILRVERLVFEAIAHKVDDPYDLYKRNNILNETKWFFTSMCCAVTTVLVLGVYFYRNIGVAGGILMGNIYLLMKYLDKISELFFKFTSMYSDILQRKARVMNAEELSYDFRAGNFTNHVLPKDWRRLAMEHLNFSYGSGSDANLHLDDVSLTFERGERIAFIGESGGGKTTLLNIMRDTRHPQNIALSVDGKFIPHGFEGIARAITLVPQDAEIFASTILWNLTMGAEYDLDFVRQFTDMACVTEVIEKLPRNFDSQIKEKGVNLSAGQRQRLALARGLLACHDKDIVLLDEPTSNLDAINESQIFENIFRVFATKTIVTVTHNLRLLPRFDRIYLFSKGKIVASGTFNELKSSSPEFQELWRKYREHEIQNQNERNV